MTMGWQQLTKIIIIIRLRALDSVSLQVFAYATKMVNRNDDDDDDEERKNVRWPLG